MLSKMRSVVILGVVGLILVGATGRAAEAVASSLIVASDLF